MLQNTPKTNAQRLKESRARRRLELKNKGDFCPMSSAERFTLSAEERLAINKNNLEKRIPHIRILEKESLTNGWTNQHSTVFFTCNKHGGNFSKSSKYLWDNVRHACPVCRKEVSVKNAVQHSQHMQIKAQEKRIQTGRPFLLPEEIIVQKEATERKLLSRKTCKEQNGICFISGAQLIHLKGPNNRPLLGAAATCGHTHHLNSKSLYPHHKQNKHNLVYIHSSIHGAFHKIYGEDKYSTIDQMIHFVTVISDKNHPKYKEYLDLIYDFGFFNCLGEYLTFDLDFESVLFDLNQRKKFLEAL